MAARRRLVDLVRGTLPAITALLLGALLAGCGRQGPPAAAPPPVEVTVVTVQPRSVPVTHSFLAEVKSSHQVEVVARVSGILKKIRYREGHLVRQGDVLFEMDPREYAAEAEEARAELEMKRTELAYYKADLDRIIPLAEQNAASRKDLDAAVGSHRRAESALLQAQARYDKALLKVGYCTITSPVGGVAGQALVREGGYLAAGTDTARLTTVLKVDPVWIEFSISQNEQDRLNQEVVTGRLISPRGGRYTVELELPNGVRHPHRGELTYGDFAYGKNRGSYLVRAVIPNPFTANQPLLRPGMFVKAHISGDRRPNVLLVPQRAVRQGTNGHELSVVTEQGVAEVRPVTAGEWVDNDWIITAGLRPGDRVVVDGAVKLAPGMPVRIVPAGPLPSQPAER